MTIYKYIGTKEELVNAGFEITRSLDRDVLYGVRRKNIDGVFIALDLETAEKEEIKINCFYSDDIRKQLKAEDIKDLIDLGLVEVYEE